jgi:hypothetical protein
VPIIQQYLSLVVYHRLSNSLLSRSDVGGTYHTHLDEEHPQDDVTRKHRAHLPDRHLGFVSVGLTSLRFFGIARLRQ